MVSRGWPSVVSDLKTLLETGETLPSTHREAVVDTINERHTSVAAR
jgi:hypothetical protein